MDSDKNLINCGTFKIDKKNW